MGKNTQQSLCRVMHSSCKLIPFVFSKANPQLSMIVALPLHNTLYISTQAPSRDTRQRNTFTVHFNVNSVSFWICLYCEMSQFSSLPCFSPMAMNTQTSLTCNASWVVNSVQLNSGKIELLCNATLHMSQVNTGPFI